MTKKKAALRSQLHYISTDDLVIILYKRKKKFARLTHS